MQAFAAEQVSKQGKHTKMSQSIRLMPALIAVSLGSFAFKAIDIAEAAVGAPEPEHETDHGDEDADVMAQDDSHAPDVDAFDAHDEGGVMDANYGYETVRGDGQAEEDRTDGDACLASPDFSAETGLSQYEIQVLRSLADRRQVLEDRAAELDTREQLAAAAELRLDDQITELKELEAGVQSLLDAMEVKRDERMDGLVKVYESMKPKDAARIFNTLDNDVLLSVSMRMKHANLAAVMSNMSSERAQQLTRLLADRAAPPGDAEEVLARANAS